MNTSMFIGKAFSFYIILTLIPMLFKAKNFKKTYNDLLASSVSTTSVGILTLILGIILVMNHNVWVKDWTVVVTILSWWLLVKGFLLVYFPNRIVKPTKNILKQTNYYYLVVIINAGIAGYLLYNIL